MPIHHTPSPQHHASTSASQTGQTSGMTRLPALVSVSPNLCATLMIAHPHSSSAVHHHGAQDTIVYARSGRGAVVSEGGRKRQEVGPGDFVLIPAWEEHQEVNDGDEDFVAAIVRGPGGEPVVENLEGWGASLKGRSEKEEAK